MHGNMPGMKRDSSKTDWSGTDKNEKKMAFDNKQLL